ncbi:MAG TPA: exodeoxyribonuclease III [Microbacteriaceae bacterium]|nr:exodeoxyribonuclease III [Microbacteriaceae bacterium]
MRIATWNVNSIRTRVARVVDWLERADIDALAMQEIKCKPEQFPLAAFEDAGYEVVLHGLNQWNGVAIASRIGIEDVEIGFPGQPGFAKGHDGPDAPLEARAIGATVGGGVRLWSLYVPNGRALGDPHYDYKLRWLEALRTATVDWLADDPHLGLLLGGDYNIAPSDADSGDPTIRVGVSTHVSPPERAAFQALLDAGLEDVVRPLVPTGYTYWDYQQLRFPRNEGMRIDFLLASTSLAEAVIDAEIHREERKGEAPSDHVPVVVRLAEDDDEADSAAPF